MEKDYLKLMEISSQASTISGITRTLTKDIQEGEHGNYTFGYVPAASTKTRIHNKIVMLRGELNRLDKMIQGV